MRRADAPATSPTVEPPVAPPPAAIDGATAPATRSRRLALLLAPLLGVLATLAFPPYDGVALAPVALAALFALAAGRSARQAFALGALFGFAHFASGIYWVYISTHVYGGAPWWLSLVLGAVLFAYMALYPALVLYAAARLGLWRGASGWIGVPALWLLAELLRGWVYSGFPWLSLGYVAIDLPLARAAPLVGVHGLSALLALSAYALWRSYAARGRARLVALAVALAPLALALLLPAPERWTAPVGTPLSVAIVQGNIAQDQKWKPEMQWPTLTRYHQMTLAAAGADLVVWPEVALTQRYDQVREPYLLPIAGALAAQGGTLLAGIVIGDEARHGYYNSIVALGASEGRYDKRHLVPFGEYFPIPDWLRPIMDVLGTPYEDFLFGEQTQAPVTVRDQRVGLSICFEDVFGSEIRRDARAAGLLVNLTNDAWFGDSSAAHQHLQIARTRALETGRVLVRAANTGISAIIDERGGFVARSGWFTTEILRGSVQPRSGVTPYARWGNAPLWGLSLLIAGWLVIRAVRGSAGARHSR